MIFWFKKFFTKAPPKQKDRQQEIADKYKKMFLKTHTQQVDFLKIGEYQLLNLFSNPIKFVLLDLRDANQNPYFKRSIMSQEESALDVLVKAEIQLSDAVVIICKTGEKSMRVAHQLAQKKFTNIVVLEHGTEALSDKAHNIQDLYYRGV